MEFLILATIGLLILFSALFSAVETAFFSLRPEQILRFKQTRPARARRLEKILVNPRRLLSAILLADTCSNLPLIILCLLVMNSASEQSLPLLASALFLFAVVVILCDLLPKLMALRAPERIASFGAVIMNRLLPFFDPFCRLLQHASEWMARLLTPKSAIPVEPLAEGELETLIQIGAEEGVFQVTESEIIQEILKLGGKSAHDCMMPRTDAFTIPDDLSNEEALTRLRAKRFRRVPVYADTPDNIVGILDVKRFLMERGPAPLHYTEQLAPPSYVPETMKAIDLLRSFLRHPQRMAIVVDEFGGTEGIVTLPDIIDHIVSDALPPAGDQELYIANFGAGRLIVAGNARLDDLSERLGVRLTREGIDTVGGLVFTHLGYVPKAGETLELSGLRITVRRSSRKRIQEMLIEPKNLATSEERENPAETPIEPPYNLEDGEQSGAAS